MLWNFSGSSVVSTSPYNTRGGGGFDPWSGSQKAKPQDRSNIVTNSIKALKMVHIKKKKKKLKIIKTVCSGHNLSCNLESSRENTKGPWRKKR